MSTDVLDRRGAAVEGERPRRPRTPSSVRLATRRPSTSVRASRARPGASALARKSVVSPSASAAISIASATWPSSTKCLTPSSRQPEAARVALVGDRAGPRAFVERERDDRLAARDPRQPVRLLRRRAARLRARSPTERRSRGRAKARGRAPSRGRSVRRRQRRNRCRRILPARARRSSRARRIARQKTAREAVAVRVRAQLAKLRDRRLRGDRAARALHQHLSGLR